MAPRSWGGQTGVMVTEVRPIRPEEGAAFRHSVMVPFLAPYAGDADQVADDEQWATKLEPERAWVVDADGRFAGNACIYSLDVTLPAAPGQPCPVVPMAGVSAVGVHPTHRRRGYLRQLMAAMHDDARSRGEVIAGLEASESVIYGRFGYGLAADVAEYAIDSRSSRFAVPAPEVDVRLVDREEAAAVLPAIFDRQRRTRAGEVDRNAATWAYTLRDAPHDRGGASARFHAVCDDGYVLYRADIGADVFRAERPAVTIDDLRGTTPGIEAALWRFVLDLDLVGRVTAHRRPVDEPVRWRLADPRQLQTVGVEDRLYLRILDTPGAFEARGYQGEGRLVIDVLEPESSEGAADPAPGRWVLEAGAAGASCRRSRKGEAADLRLELPTLGTLFLGGFPASLLASAGHIEELRPGALAVADRVLMARPAPRSGTGF